MVSLTVAVIAGMTLAAAAFSGIAQAQTNTADLANTTTTSTTTTTPHICEGDNPCSAASICEPVGHNHVCRCRATYSGVDSADGDGCFRSAITTAGADSATGKHGLTITVGEGADVHVQAGGPLRGEATSVLQQARDLKSLLAMVQHLIDVEVSKAKQDILANAAAIRTSEALVKDLIDIEISKAKQDILANAAAISAEVSRAKGQEVVLGAAIDAEKVRATAQEGMLDAAIESEAARAQTAEAKLQASIDMEASCTLAYRTQTRCSFVQTWPFSHHPPAYPRHGARRWPAQRTRRPPSALRRTPRSVRPRHC